MSLQDGFTVRIAPVVADGLAEYMSTDPVGRLLDEPGQVVVASLTTDRWLRESAAKRYVYWSLYGDLLSGGGKRVLDIGGGLSALTPSLARQNAYHLVELFAHDASVAAEAMASAVPEFRFTSGDWHDFVPEADYDVVVANDLFPNVDQRLVSFMRKFLPKVAELRLSLTYYDHPKFYVARRIQGDEILTMQAWDGAQTYRALCEVLGEAVSAFRTTFHKARPSLFPNGRQVCLARIGHSRSSGAV